jgi:hypothetical protein
MFHSSPYPTITQLTDKVEQAAESRSASHATRRLDDRRTPGDSVRHELTNVESPPERNNCGSQVRTLLN